MSTISAMPIIKLEVESMKHTVIAMLSEYFAKMDEDIRRAVHLACTAEKISLIISETAEREIKAVIEEEISRFFRYGDGRSAVRDTVTNMLKDQGRRK